MRATLSKFFGATLFSVASLTMAAEIDVMTQNQYLGAELTPVPVAGQSGDPVAFNAAVVQALGKIAATRPAVRVRALSWQIQLRAPDVVGVQEAYEFTCAPLSPEQQVNPCEHPQLKARQRWREVGSPAGPLPAMLPPGTWSEGPRMDPVPALGEHTDAILAELGFGAADIRALRAAEAI